MDSIQETSLESMSQFFQNLSAIRGKSINCQKKIYQLIDCSGTLDKNHSYIELRLKPLLYSFRKKRTTQKKHQTVQMLNLLKKPFNRAF